MIGRCRDGFYEGCCPVSDCEHFDGKGDGAAPIVTRFVYCISCSLAAEASESTPVHHGKWRCRDCSICERCKVNPRPGGKEKYCAECHAILIAPKACDRCGEPMHCRKTKQGLNEHIRRRRHFRCSVDMARKNMTFCGKVTA